MGWLFDRNSNQYEQKSSSSQQDSIFGYTFNKSSSSRTKTCKSDPEDGSFLICKTVIKDEKGTREEEERVPVGEVMGTTVDSAAVHERVRQNLDRAEKTLQDFQLFPVQTTFTNAYNSSGGGKDPNSGAKITSSYKKTTCMPDHQDDEYLICKTLVSDKDGTRQFQQRVKRQNKFKIQIPSFTGEFAKAGHEIDHEMHNLMSEMNHGFSALMPFAGLFMNFAKDLEHLDRDFSSFQQGQSQQNYFPADSDYVPRQYENDGRYFSSSQAKKDTSVYDL